MFRIKFADSRSCSVIDDRDCVTFTGSLQQCEDWLDQFENLKSRRDEAGVAVPAPITLSWLGRIADVVAHRKHPVAQ